MSHLVGGIRGAMKKEYIIRLRLMNLRIPCRKTLPTGRGASQSSEVLLGKDCFSSIGNFAEDFNRRPSELFFKKTVSFCLLLSYETFGITVIITAVRIDMDFFSILLVAIGLGMDAFAVAIATGVTIRKLSFGPVFRLSFHFGFFQFLMPVIGWMAGRTVSGYIAEYDHWIAFGLLFLIGCKMIIDSLREETIERTDPTRGFTLIMLSVATSIDALAVGLGFAFLNTGILYPSIVIGIVALVMTIIGMVFARILSRLLGGVVETIGGLILIAIGIKILIEHL